MATDEQLLPSIEGFTNDTEAQDIVDPATTENNSAASQKN